MAKDLIISNNLRLYEGDKLAASYDDRRPEYPDEIRLEVLRCINENKALGVGQRFMLDVGCGGGKATKLFANDFEQILGIDISQSQIELARTNVAERNVQFEVVTDNLLPVESNSVDVVLCGTAFHLLDTPLFLAECDRVLVVGGVLACVAYEVDHLEDLDGKTIVQAADGSKMRQLSWNFQIESGFEKSRLERFRCRYEHIFSSIKNPNKRLTNVATVKEKFSTGKMIKLMSTLAGYMSRVYPDPKQDPLNVYLEGFVEILREAGLHHAENADFVLCWAFWAMLVVKTKKCRIL